MAKAWTFTPYILHAVAGLQESTVLCSHVHDNCVLSLFTLWQHDFIIKCMHASWFRIFGSLNMIGSMSFANMFCGSTSLFVAKRIISLLATVAKQEIFPVPAQRDRGPKQSAEWPENVHETCTTLIMLIMISLHYMAERVSTAYLRYNIKNYPTKQEWKYMHALMEPMFIWCLACLQTSLWKCIQN